MKSKFEEFKRGVEAGTERFNACERMAKYLLEDRGCKLQYVGSTSDVCSRWANTKSGCNGHKSKMIGLTSHFMEGCPSDTGLGKDHIRLTPVDFMDTTVWGLGLQKLNLFLGTD